jgi:rod shape determining protein RodA
MKQQGLQSMKYKVSIFDAFSLLSVICFCLLGLLLLYSAAGGNKEPWMMKQLITILAVLPLLLVLLYLDIGFLYKNSYIIYWLGISLLIVAEVVGHKAMGAQRWIKIGSFTLQPSEFIKIGVILVLARYFHNLHSNQVGKIRNLIWPITHMLLPSALILHQPNLGTTLIIITISAAIFFTAGVRIWKFLVVIASAIISVPVIWHFMHQYQKQRVLTFLDPEKDPLGSGYNIMQSKIAIGSGGLFGKGFLSGSQSQLSFLPEKQTDFIFTLFAEEFGFFMVVLLLLIYFGLCIYSYHAAFKANSQFSRLICIGSATMLFLHMFINTAMISGLLPVVGTPFSFLSYGGSNLAVSLFMIFMVIKISLSQKNR